MVYSSTSSEVVAEKDTLPPLSRIALVSDSREVESVLARITLNDLELIFFFNSCCIETQP